MQLLRGSIGVECDLRNRFLLCLVFVDMSCSNDIKRNSMRRNDAEVTPFAMIPFMVHGKQHGDGE